MACPANWLIMRRSSMPCRWSACAWVSSTASRRDTPAASNCSRRSGEVSIRIVRPWVSISNDARRRRLRGSAGSQRPQSAAAAAAMQIPGRRAFLLQDAGDLGIRLAGMNDQWQPARPGRRDVGPEDPLLHLARAVVVMEIEPGLANADDARKRRERSKIQYARLRVIGGFMRMHA